MTTSELEARRFDREEEKEISLAVDANSKTRSLSPLVELAMSMKEMIDFDSWRDSR